MFEEIGEIEVQFEKHVPYASETFLILKSHLLIEVGLLEFIKERVPSELYNKISRPKEGATSTRLILAEALYSRDEIKNEYMDAIWKPLSILNSLRNSVAHTLEYEGTAVPDKMREFVKAVDSEVECSASELNTRFREAAKYVAAILAINKSPVSLALEAGIPSS